MYGDVDLSWRDDDAARRWYREAARAGNQVAKKRLQSLG